MHVQARRWCTRLALGVALTALWAAGASAQGRLAATMLTFDRAVRVPGVTLPKGTYMFVRVAGDPDGRTVQIFRASPRRLVTTIMAVPTIRDGGGPDVVFADGPRGSLAVLRTWYERGTQTGYSFVYTRSELASIMEPGAELSTR